MRAGACRPCVGARPRSRPSRSPSRRRDPGGGRSGASPSRSAIRARPSTRGSASTSRGPRHSRPRTESQAAVQAHAQSWSHHVGAGAAAAPTASPDIRTPRRVATSSEPLPRVMRWRSSHPWRSSRRACELATLEHQPIADLHASNGAGPTLTSHASPAIDAGPGSSSAIDGPLLSFSTPQTLTQSRLPESPHRPAPAPGPSRVPSRSSAAEADYLHT